MKEEKEKKRGFAKFVLIFWGFIVSAIGFFVIMLYAAGNAWPGFDELPSFEQLENPKSNLATEVYTTDGKILGKYFYQNRVNVDYRQLSPHLVNALIATEDERYYQHSGIDLKGLARAVVNFGKSGGASTITQQLAKMLFSEAPKSKVDRIKQKLQEWIIAAQLEKRYTKEEVISMYFNRFDFINNAVGIKSASQIYFNKSPDSLNVHESATLVGMLKNPSLFNPISDRRKDTTLQRRNVVLGQMLRNEFISKSAFDSLIQLPLEIIYTRESHKEGIAPYFRSILREELKQLFNEKDADDKYKYVKANGEPYDIYKDGLKIYTTLNYTMQEYAEWAMKEHLSKRLQKDFFKSLSRKKNAPFDYRVSQKEIDNILKSAIKRSERYLIKSGRQCANCGRRGRFLKKEEKNGNEMVVCQADDCGHHSKIHEEKEIIQSFEQAVPMKIFSWRGEIDTVMSPLDSIRYYKSFLQSGLMSMDPQTGYVKAWVGGIDYNYFAYDHVKQGKRQVGSTFKPFVYAVAIDEGYSPCLEVPNVRYVFPKEEWDLPEDWSPKNSDGKYGCEISLKYALATSTNSVTARIMKDFGPERVIKMARSMGITSHLDTVPSLCLGVADVSLYEMVGAFSTFANKGVWTKPQFLTRIEDKDGNVIKEFIPKTREALSEDRAYVMLELLKGVTSYNYHKCENRYIGGSGIRLTSPPSEDRPYVGINTPIAAKTGTTQNQSDGWFMGVTPDLVTGVWVGAEDRSVRFPGLREGQGANTALPIWGYYMKKIYADSTIQISKGDFEKPEEPLDIELDCEKFRKQNNFGENAPNFGAD